MPRAQYVVAKQEGEWKITFGGKQFGPYTTEKAAIRAAVDAAHGTGKLGYDAQVVSLGEDNKRRTEWTYGQDPYPPKD